MTKIISLFFCGLFIFGCAMSSSNSPEDLLINSYYSMKSGMTARSGLYAEKARKICEEKNDRDCIGKSLYFLGYATKKENSEKSEQYFKQSSMYLQEYGYFVNVYLNLADLAYAKGDKKSACADLKKSSEYYSKSDQRKFKGKALYAPPHKPKSAERNFDNIPELITYYKQQLGC